MTTESPSEPLHGKPYEIGLFLNNPFVSVIHSYQHITGV